MESYIKLSRKIREHWIWEDAELLKRWIDLLMLVNYAENKFLCNGKLVKVNIGEHYTSEEKLAKRWGISRKSVDKFLKLLESDGMIKMEKSRTFGTRLKVLNYGIYQGKNENLEQQKEHQKHNKSTSKEHQKHINNKYKININNKKLYSSDEEYNQKGEPFCSNAETVKNEFGDAEPAQSNTLTVKEQIAVQRQRYNTEQLKVIDDFLDILKYTRRGGKIADNVILKIYESWNKYEVQKVIFGLNKYNNNPNLHDKKENYVQGIIRNCTAEEIHRKSDNNTVPAKPNKFVNYEQREWDFDALNKLKGELLERITDNSNK